METAITHNTTAIDDDTIEMKESTTPLPQLPPVDSPDASSFIERYRRRYRRWVLYGLAFALISLSSGLVYGWPALRRHLLEVDDSTLDEQQLGVIFTIGSWSTQGGRFFVGFARDRWGTRRVICACLMGTTLGSIGIALSDPDSVAALSVSLFAIGSGSGVQLCTQPVAGLFPQNAGVVLSSLAGAFQVSGLVFLALTSGSASRRASFLALASSLVVSAVIAVLLFPKGGSFLLEDLDEKTEEMDKTEATMDRSDKQDENDNAAVSREMEEGQNEEAKEDSSPPPESTTMPELKKKRQEESEQSEVIVPKNALQQMKNLEYILLLLWFSFSLIPMQYYVGVIGFLLEEKGDTDGFYTDIFSYTYAGATITSPFAGWVADRFGLGISQGLATALLAASFFILASNASLQVQSVGMFVYGVGRLAIFGNYFTNLGKRFGYLNFGTLSGLGLLLSAIVSLLQYPLIATAAEGNAAVVNNVLGTALLVQAPYFVWLYRREKRSSQADLF